MGSQLMGEQGLVDVATPHAERPRVMAKPTAYDLYLGEQVVGTIQMHEEPRVSVTPDDPPGVTDAIWVLEVNTWDRRSLSISFHHESTAHEQAVKLLMLQEQIIEILDSAKRAGFDFKVVEG
jgi:hypothetical protein